MITRLATVFSETCGLQNEPHVFDGDHHRQRPEDQGHDAQQVGVGEGDGVVAVEAFPDGVQGAGADVAVDDPQGTQGEDQGFLEVSAFRWAVVGIS
jgi:hypothetical protein